MLGTTHTGIWSRTGSATVGEDGRVASYSCLSTHFTSVPEVSRGLPFILLMHHLFPFASKQECDCSPEPSSSTAVPWKSGSQINVSYQPDFPPEGPVHTRHAHRYPFSCNAIHGTDARATECRNLLASTKSRRLRGAWLTSGKVVGLLECIARPHAIARTHPVLREDDMEYQYYTLTADMVDG